MGKVGNLGKKPAMGLRSLKKTTMILGMKMNIYDFVIAKLAEATLKAAADRNAEMAKATRA